MHRSHLFASAAATIFLGLALAFWLHGGPEADNSSAIMATKQLFTGDFEVFGIVQGMYACV